MSAEYDIDSLAFCLYNQLMFKRFQVGLALGGGAARGLAHIGVLQFLNEQNIPIHILTGTSIGAIIGGMYATEPDIHQLKKKVYSYLESDIFMKAKFDFLKEKDTEEGEGIFYKFSHVVQRGIFYTLSLTRKSFISEETFMNNLGYLLKDINMEDTQIPFAVTSVDLNSGEEFVIKSGSLLQAVAASCALPGIIQPVIYSEKLLVDGGWLDAVPINPALQLGADVTIGVEVARDISEFEEPKNALDIVFRSDTITRYALSKLTIDKADFVLSPDIGAIHWADFSRVDECIQKGRDEMATKLKDLKKMIRKKRFLKFFRGIW